MGTMLGKSLTLRHQELTSAIIAAAITVHQQLGPGFLESIYEAALCIELDLRGISYERQKVMTLKYRDRIVGEHRLDLLVEGVLIVELKAVKELENIFFTITRSYMKAAGVDDGLLLNFASMPLTIKRVAREHSHYRAQENQQPSQRTAAPHQLP
jgi:GxxExxY protein